MPGAIVAEREHVTLRTPEPEDAGFCQRARVNPEIRYPIGNPVESREELAVTTTRDGGDAFIVTVADTGGRGTPEEGTFERVGWVGLDDVSYRRPELGYWIAAEHQGEGYSTEAVVLAVDYSFRTYDHPAVGARAYAFNDASRALLESLGFEEEGRVRRDRFVDGEYVDTVLYGLLREHWGGPDDVIRC
jgi:RimJ/RimL family protein N-acetyltransferase